ncbi:farnesyl cysteine-carboxyl methyltransferase, putative [Candida dubliniensis CD36]|uniref:Protein-S-isoprenylcysteine O-methyltransferase n=1 Tax=Candida dubliniensis (strain CD36 / ATCC MYA-646 / CBS 7987 / NCPF 3949 / NRRL Y-17841) TaxID=573826 RepID=B9WIJ1_CANDC|nr:farnesyl cysteine-carboxyl methyltransferase, putative [Candida dubliniensis CD36]CAX41056.1 farnesyl cysteine-carboxyl methyltransferase, putative [Candida dubliniensis CD36]
MTLSTIFSKRNLSRYNPEKVNLLKIVLKSFLLGSLFTINLYNLLFTFNKFWYQINLFIIFLIIFHNLEFINTVLFNNSQVDDDSFILEDKEMFIINLLSIIEHIIIHNYDYFNLKFYTDSKFVYGIGLILIIIGQFIRSLSMYTAKSSFNHYIQKEKKESKTSSSVALEQIDNTDDNNDVDADDDMGHKLITTGIYSIFRHPSYFGFFIWFLGLQIFLNNIIVLIIGGIILWKFFNERIQFEEIYLVKFFGIDYINYRNKTKTWMMI